MIVGFYQMNPVRGDTDANLTSVQNLLKEHRPDLLVLPELFNSGYLFSNRTELLKEAESIPNGKTASALLDFSSSSGTAIIAGMAERAGDKIFNSAILVTKDRQMHVYRKMHLFDSEKCYFDRGDSGFQVFSLGQIKIGIMICFDWIFPEAARTLALKGAAIIAHPSNLTLPYCPEAMITRCLENRVFAITCNRIGNEVCGETRISFIGSSQIVAPDGQILVQAGRDEEIYKSISIDPVIALDKKMTNRNDLFADRRSEFYLT
jgi:5-aminopentanamidase